MVRMAKCCNPVPGDDIIGYITRGRGVSIHRCDCPSMGHSPEDLERMIGSLLGRFFWRIFPRRH